MDMISSLPDPLLCHILSFLPTTSSVATSILSRRWRHLWKHLQILDLVDCPFYEGQKAEECFVAFVSEVLAQVRHIQKFRLSCALHNRDALRSWINSVTGPHLQELHFSLVNINWNHTLPRGVFTCTSLVSLVLKDDISLDDLPSVNLPSLKNLELDIPYVDIDKLLSGCPVLETLNVNLCLVDNPAIIHMPRSLKSLTFQYNWISCSSSVEHLEIDISPSLEYLHVQVRDRYVRVLVSNFPNMVEARLDICPKDVHVGWVSELFKVLCRTKLLVLEVAITEVICLKRAHNPLNEMFDVTCYSNFRWIYNCSYMLDLISCWIVFYTVLASCSGSRLSRILLFASSTTWFRTFQLQVPNRLAS